MHLYESAAVPRTAHRVILLAEARAFGHIVHAVLAGQQAAGEGAPCDCSQAIVVEEAQKLALHLQCMLTSAIARPQADTAVHM